MGVVIDVDRLSKRYMINHQSQAKYLTFRDAMTDAARRIGKRLLNPIGRAQVDSGANEEFWALRNVSFTVQAGDRIGVIGRNGAGKSTLLKLLSRITEPTAGRISIEGRVASLLEVGTGFHPELTGRENIYLNGAILGMRRAEIKRRFDEIVSFSEVERFLDTPVKRYSSGMYVRLAFAVAAHLEPEILIVDEVLAVGDAQFQKKCLGKMEEVGKEGRTILFVSHNMAAITTLCTKGVLLNQGSVVTVGNMNDVVAKYLELGRDSDFERVWPEFSDAPGDDDIRIAAVRVVSEGEAKSDIAIDKEITIEIEYWNRKPGAKISTSIHVFDRLGVGVLASANMAAAVLKDDGWCGRPYPEGKYLSRCTIPGNFLNEGLYSINAIVLTDIMNTHACVDEAVSFTVQETGDMRKEYSGHWLGVVRPKLDWQTVVREKA